MRDILSPTVGWKFTGNAAVTSTCQWIVIEHPESGGAIADVVARMDERSESRCATQETWLARPTEGPRYHRRHCHRYCSRIRADAYPQAHRLRRGIGSGSSHTCQLHRTGTDVRGHLIRQLDAL